MSTRRKGRPAIASPQAAGEALKALRVPGSKVIIRSAGRGKDVALPADAIDSLREILGALARGERVEVVPSREELTTQEAADFLGVSRPYLIGLLDAGKVPFRLVGTHRRVRVVDLTTYRALEDARRSEAVEELAREAERLGLGY